MTNLTALRDGLGRTRERVATAALRCGGHMREHAVALCGGLGRDGEWFGDSVLRGGSGRAVGAGNGSGSWLR